MTMAGEAGPDLIMICDDIAYRQGLFFSPRMFEDMLLPHYRKLISSTCGEPVLGFHSDGNIEAVAGLLCRVGFSVFSLEPEAMDLVGIRAVLSREAVIMSGIKADWLMDPRRDAEEQEILDYISALAAGGGLILASCCGVYEAGGLAKLRCIGVSP